MKLASIFDWCNDNNLSLNPAKCKFMLVTSKKVNLPLELLIGNNSINRVNHFKYLGMFMDSNLKF